MMKAFWAVILVATTTALTPQAVAADGDDVGKPLAPWRMGEMDIHHIATGSGNSAFFVLPDGTTMLFDAGDTDRQAINVYAPLKMQAPVPDATRRSGQWIADYIRQFAPTQRSPRIDYAVISHFHTDHFGALQASSPLSRTGAYRLTGITDVAEDLPIGALIDRAAPAYVIPVDLKSCHPPGKPSSLSNYFAFVAFRLAHHQAVEGIRVGRNDQIRLVHAPERFQTFEVRNLAANGVIWSGSDNKTTQIIPWAEAGGCAVPENPFSIALRLRYGRFSYYTGGDLTGAADPDEPAWKDMETPLSRVVGLVSAMSLNHHGNRDATNAAFLGALRPRVIVEQNWISDQPGGEVVHRMISAALYPGPRDIFSTGMTQETRIAIGPWLEHAYRSFSGHVVIRVYPDGTLYDVFVLDETTPQRLIKAHLGPYKA